MLGGGALYQGISYQIGTPLDDFSKAISLMISLTFLQPSSEFSDNASRQSALEKAETYQAHTIILCV